MTFRFIDHKDILLSKVIALGKKNSNTLGLFPKGAFIEHAKKKWIVIAEEQDELLGYALFRVSQTTNIISIAHLCVDNAHRKKGVAALLLDQIKRKLHRICRGISLRCREDYTTATEFWKKYGFIPSGKVRSRSKEEHYLVLWWYSFNNQDLFSNTFESDKIKALLDANIICDLRDSTSNTNLESKYLLADWLVDEVNYYYSPELHHEINRDSDVTRAKATRKLLANFTEASCNISTFNSSLSELKNILPNASENDISDCNQIASAIAAGIEYFITKDRALLSKADILFTKFNIAVMRPSDFIVIVDQINNKSDYQPTRLAGANYEINKIEAAELSIITNEFLNKSNSEKKYEFIQLVTATAADIKNSIIKVVKDKDQQAVAIIGLAEKGERLEVPFVRLLKNLLSNTLFKQLIYVAIIHAIKRSKHVISITEPILDIEQVSILQNFSFTLKDGVWSKVALHGITKSHDLFAQHVLLNQYFDKTIILKKLNSINEKEELNLFQLKLERSLWPLKFSDIEIPTYIIPIKPYWASQLFDHPSAEGLIFGSKPELSWNRENIYYRSINPNIEVLPARVLWYASTDRRLSRSNSIIACSYLDEIHIDTAKSLYQKFKRYGIYEWQDIYKLAKSDAYKEIKALKFSDTEIFSTPISLKKVQEILGKKHTFPSPLKISSHSFNQLYILGKELKQS